MEQEERFLPIPGWEDKYSIGDKGTVISHYRGNDRALKHKLTKQGHHYITLSIEGGLGQSRRTRNAGIARAMALAFIPNPDDLPEVKLLNGDKDDLRLENIAWSTHNFDCRKSQAWLYKAWHKDRPEEVMIFSSKRQAMQGTGLCAVSLTNYLLRHPGEPGKTGWCIQTQRVENYAQKIISNTK
jgi:hypothetical protein